jgi:nitroreductase
MIMSASAGHQKVPIPASQVDYLIATAGRAPSVHNTQPWRFRVRPDALELYADPARKLRIDPLGREMLISCGAALFGLRLGIRSLGFMPVIELLPDAAHLALLARVSLGEPQPMNGSERRMLEALPHRHTHRGPFTAEPLPAGLLASLQHDAVAEAATLVLVDRGRGYEPLADIVAAAGRRLDLIPRARADMRDWTRRPGAGDRDGVPASAFAGAADHHRGRLPQRDFDLGRHVGQLAAGGPAPAATALVLTPGDSRADWLCAGQALHRVLAHAAARWVFASLHTQPLEAGAIRSLIRDRLVLPGVPQIILQLGCARTTRVTARRPAPDLIDL